MHAQFDIIRIASVSRDDAPDIEALVQVVTVNANRDQTIAEFGMRVQDVPVQDLGSTPYMLVGTLTDPVTDPPAVAVGGLASAADRKLQATYSTWP